MRILVLFYAIFCFIPSAFAASENGHAKHEEGYILVKPKAGLTESKLSRILARSGGAAVGIQRKLDKLGIKKIRVPRGREEEFAEMLRQENEFEFAEPDAFVAPSEYIPDDPKVGSQWHLTTIGAPIAWEDTTGEGIIVAVLDTGVYAGHPDLAGRVLSGRNVASSNSDTSDIMGHGTAVAGTIAAAGDNGVGIASVAYNARILPVRISDRTDGVASFSNMAAGITWAADNGARVVNLSYAAARSSSVQSAARYMRNKGGLVFVAAGNDGIDPGWTNYPDIIVVSATDRSDAIAGFSNYGQFVDISAPGDYIYTTNKSGGYSNWRGTSFSSPVAAGVAASLMGLQPELDAGRVFEIMAETATDNGEEGWDAQFGAGRVDLGEAVTLTGVAPEPETDTIEPNVSILNPTEAASVSGLVPVDVSANDNISVVAVDLFINELPIGTDFDPPYAFVWDSALAGDGPHSIIARARDAAGNVGESLAINVLIEEEELDGNGPSVTISSPRDGATVSGTVQVSAFAQDDNGVQQITLSAGGKMLCAGAPNVSCGWNTRKLSAGSYSVTATAKDNAGNSSSTSISVTVGSGGGSKGGKGGKGGRGGPKNKK